MTAQADGAFTVLVVCTGPTRIERTRAILSRGTRKLLRTLDSQLPSLRLP